MRLVLLVCFAALSVSCGGDPPPAQPATSTTSAAATSTVRTVEDVASEYVPQMQLLLDNGCNRPADPQCAHWLTDMVQLSGELRTELQSIGGHDDIVAKVDAIYDSSERFAADRCFEAKNGAMPGAACAIIGVTLQTNFSTALTMLRTAAIS